MVRRRRKICNSHRSVRSISQNLNFLYIFNYYWYTYTCSTRYYIVHREIFNLYIKITQLRPQTGWNRADTLKGLLIFNWTTGSERLQFSQLWSYYSQNNFKSGFRWLQFHKVLIVCKDPKCTGVYKSSVLHRQ